MNQTAIFIIYLIYGLAFFAIGAAITFRNIRFSNLAIASALPALATFGYVHGVHEWSEMYWLLMQESLEQSNWMLAEGGRVLKLAVSYFAMVWFAWAMLDVNKLKHKEWLKALTLCVLGIYVAVILFHWQVLSVDRYLSQSAVFTRLVFGFGASFTAGVLLIRYGLNLKKQSGLGGRYFAYSGFALIGYGIAAGLVKGEYGLWVPMLRSFMAILLLLFLLQALKVFDSEREKQIQSQLKKAMQNDRIASLGQLAAGIAHEIKTPLANATLALDVLKKKSDNEEHLQLLSRIKRSLLRANHITQEVLTFARTESASPQRLQVLTLVNSALDLLAYRARDFHILTDVSAELVVEGDKVALEEVLINLLTNAMDASDQGGNISIVAAQSEGLVRIEIRDQGSGISEHILDKVFNPFFTTKSAGKGTGLGLSISREIIEQHLGQLFMENKQQGVLVTVCLPSGEAV
ncbi:sensor histidine kinase [Paraferrimonas haliotis]|uniref:sensor histidine kinase n=1 Tax=Paraferrimonas haliotis TaxID=2013866 RepID=UPI000BA98E7C|nr:HAMP domain-containing sensor histidine kinase [Paraferrimonas haliotis]